MKRNEIMKQIFILHLLFLLLVSSANADEIFKNPTVGFSVMIPSAWHYLTTQDIQKGKKNVRLNDRELQEAIQKYATAPLVAISKYKEPYDDLNTSFKVIFRPLGQLKGASATEIMKLVVPSIQKLVNDFEYIDTIQPTIISGLQAASMSANYNVSNQENRVFNIYSKMYLVPRGDYMFMISGSSKADSSDNSLSELNSIFKSIKITE